MTIFRGELGGWFLVMFICLLVGKVWGWIGEGRVEFVEQQPPANPRVFHTRLTASLTLSILFNAFMLRFCVQTVLEQARPDMMVMFGFEFAVLSILSLSTAARYGISLVEIYVTQQQMRAKVEERREEIRASRQEAMQQQGEDAAPADMPDENEVNEMELDIPGWEEKGRWVFYLDLVTDFFKLIVYLTFFTILFTFYGLPIHILRDVILTIRSFGRRIMDFVRYRNAIRDMNERYHDATAEEVSNEDVCIICREEMTPWQPAEQAAPGRPAGARRIPERLRPKRLPCGHILHFACLRSWLERQQNCPTCRRPVIMPRNRAGEGNAGAGPQQNIPGRNGAQDGLPRARVYQFGPFRIGFGAGRGDLFHNLHQQIHQGNAPLQPPGNVNPPAGARQIGFGFGFGRPPPAPAPAAPAPAAPAPMAVPTAAPATQPTFPSTASSSASIQDQLQQIEQQILQELDSLRVSVHQLQVVRLLQAELLRLRNQQATAPDAQGTPLQGTPLQGTPLQNPPSFPSSAAPSVASRRQFMSSPRAPPLTSGDARLPEGLALPQGWSLIPLHSAGQPSSEQINTEANPPAAPEPPSSQPESGIPPVPQPFSSTENPTDNVENQNRSETADTSSSPTTQNAQNLPNWSSGSAAEPAGPRAGSPSREWTDLTAEPPTQEAEGPSTATGVDKQQQEGESSNAESSPKGKGRAVTVEDAEDDET